MRLMRRVRNLENWAWVLLRLVIDPIPLRSTKRRLRRSRNTRKRLRVGRVPRVEQVPFRNLMFLRKVQVLQGVFQLEQPHLQAAPVLFPNNSLNGRDKEFKLLIRGQGTCRQVTSTKDKAQLRGEGFCTQMIKLDPWLLCMIASKNQNNFNSVVNKSFQN